LRILVCVSDVPFPPTNTGYRRQLMGLIPELSKRNEVRMIGLQMPDQTAPKDVDPRIRVVRYEKPGALGNAWDTITATMSGRPLRAARFANLLRPALREELASFNPDVVHVGPGKLAGLHPDLAGKPAVLGVMDTWHLNVIARSEASTGLRRAVLRADVARISRFEATAYRPWDRVVPSNEDDMETMLALDPSLRMTLIPIGFDASAYAPDPEAKRDPNLIIFHGAMGYAPNVEAADFLAREILPLVRDELPDARLALVGRDPSARVLALADLPGVEVTGGVEDMRGWLTRSSVWVGPFLNGTGIKTKLLEAMATDLPCVVTSIGGRGLALDSGAFLVGETAQELAAHIVGLLRDPARAAALGKAGGDYVRAGYDWPVVGAAFERLYQEVIDEKRQGRGA
jgi:glycosyltransferase involved in cell wall biosynthesis